MAELFNEDMSANLSKLFAPDFYDYLTTEGVFKNVPDAPEANDLQRAYKLMHRSMAAQNLCTGWTPQHKIHFKHSTGDTVVPYANWEAFQAAHSADEGTLYYLDNTFSNKDHTDACYQIITHLILPISDDDMYKWLLPTKLEDLTADYTLYQGYQIVGSFAEGQNHKISIADGATVTLIDVNIPASDGDAHAGITCLGDATIMLYGASTVQGGSNEPGIQPAVQAESIQWARTESQQQPTVG